MIQMIIFLTISVFFLPSIQNDFFWTTRFRDIEIGQVQIANNSDILLLGNIYGTWVKGCIKDIFLARFDSEGNFIFAKVYGGDEFGESIGNGDYYHHWSIMTEIAGGSIYIFFITRGFSRISLQPGILKTDSQGKILWVKLENNFRVASGMPGYRISSINEVDDGIILGGYDKIVNWDPVFHKFLHDGTLVFQKTWDSPVDPWHTYNTRGFNVPGEEKLVYVVRALTNGVSTIFNKGETYVFKTNYDISSYDWRRVYATATTLDKIDVVLPYLFLVTSDGNLVLAGYTDTFGTQNVIFYKLDLSNGDVLFGKRVYVNNTDPADITPYKVIELEEGYLLSGYADIGLPGNPEFFFLVSKTDGSVLMNDFIWERDFEMKDFVVVKNTSLDGGKEEIIAAYSSKDDDDSFYKSHLTRFQVHGYQCPGTVLQTNGSSCTNISDPYCPFFIENITIYSNTHTYDFLTDTHAFPVEDITSQFKVLDATNSYKKDKEFLCFQDYTHCYGISKINSSTCSNHGICSSTDNCTCDPYYISNDCSQFECFNKPWNDSTVCNYDNGTCSGPNNCTCHNGYFGDECELWKCKEILYFNTLQCSEHGTCIKPETCLCEENYNTTKYCEWGCNGFPKDDNQVCSSLNGECVGHNNCTCKFGYRGDNCEFHSCFGVYINDEEMSEELCLGHGSCIKLDTCFCSRGYGQSVADGNCDEWFCGEFFKNDTGVCNGRGVCIAHSNCQCNTGYFGDECENWKCNGVFQDLEDVCNSKGECKSPDECSCTNWYDGNDCKNNLLVSTIVIPVAGSTGGVFLLIIIIIVISILLCLFCLAGVLCCCLCCFCILGFFVVNGLGMVSLKQKLSLKKFGKLKNVDLILEEQRIEGDETIGHINVNKDLFEIDYDELKILQLIGEGGSNSVVYKANWKGQIVAFKCFKTRTICSNQNSFNEFEREVNILASVSHPNILRFFGASLHPPRVGIVMEFCCNGDLGVYVSKNGNLFKKELSDTTTTTKPPGIPVSEKLRFCYEIVLSMEYLHNRNIIHRDLKLENVLLDKNLSCKLMDFGLSRIVSRMSQVKTSRIGTSYFMAPELVIGSGDYNEKVDVFAFGMVVYILISEVFDPYGESPTGIELRVASDPNFRPSVEPLRFSATSEHSDWIEKIVTECWNENSEVRPSFSDIVLVFQKNIEEEN